VLSTEGTASSLGLRSLAPDGVVGWERLDAAVPLQGTRIAGQRSGLPHGRLRALSG